MTPMTRPAIHKRNPIGTADIGETIVIMTPNEARQEFLDRVYRESVDIDRRINQEMRL